MEREYRSIREVLGSENLTSEQKIDELFRMDSYMYTNLGKDSSDEERKVVSDRSKRIYRAIEKIDPKTGKDLLYYLDKR